MAKPPQLLSLSPYESSDFQNISTPDTVPVDPPDVVQLKLDIINVIENRVSISSFPAEYQKKMLNFYRFHGQWNDPKYPFYPKMIRETLDSV